MRYVQQCWTCGQWLTLVGVQVLAGHYPCPVCKEGCIFVPQTALTPSPLDPFEIDYEVTVVGDDGSSLTDGVRI